MLALYLLVSQINKKSLLWGECNYDFVVEMLHFVPSGTLCAVWFTELSPYLEGASSEVLFIATVSLSPLLE